MFNCTNKCNVLCAYSKKKARRGGRQENSLPVGEKLHFSPICSKWECQWQLYILNSLLIDTDAQWLRSLKIRLSSLLVQSCTLEISQIFYFLQHGTANLLLFSIREFSTPLRHRSNKMLYLLDKH